MKKIIITGASSYIAKGLMHKLLSKGDEVYAVVRNPEKIKDVFGFSNLKIIQCDMNDYINLSKLINSKCDILFHFAWAGTSKEERMNMRIQENNIKNSLSALFAARELGCTSFIGAGSQAEYGICEGEITENYLEKPITEYGKAKLAVKRMGSEYGKTVGMNFIWTRIFSAYGVGASEESMIISCLRKMLKNEDVDLTSGIQMWDYINAADVVEAYLYLMSANFGVFNIASGEHRCIKDYVLEMKEITRSKSVLKFGSVEVSPTGKGFVPSVEKLKALGWQPTVNFREGISEIVSYLNFHEFSKKSLKSLHTIHH